MAKLTITAIANTFSAVPNTKRARIEADSTSLDKAEEGTGVVDCWGAKENANEGYSMAEVALVVVFR